MKNGVVLLACVLLLCTLTALAYKASFSPEECCFGFYPKRLQKDKVLNYKYTNKQCTKTAVLLTMKNGREFCVDPSQKWVKDIIDYMDNQQFDMEE